MKRLPTLAAFLLLAAVPVALAKAAPVPDLLRRALTPPASAQLYAYDFEDVSNARENGRSTIRGHIDPSRKKGDRVQITFVEQQRGAEDNDRKQPDPKRIDERYERDADGDIFCDSFSKDDVTNVSDKGASNGARIFAFTPRPEQDIEGEMKAVMKKVIAEAVIDEATANLRSFTARLTRPHNVMLIAEVKSMSMATDCAPAPNGRAYTTRTEMNLSGSGLGRSFTVNSTQSISNLTPVG